MSEQGGGELPVTHTGLWTALQSRSDPFLEVPGSGRSGADVPMLSFLSRLASRTAFLPLEKSVPI